MNTCLEKAIQGDPASVRELVEALRPRIASMARHYARRSGEDADDLIQEAWLGLLEALPELDVSIGVPEQYLIQRARWRLLDDLKRRRVRKCLPLEDAAVEDLVGSGDGRADERLYLDEFRGQLKSVQQLVLCYLLGGLTWREAGDLLGCSSANIAYHVRQIRKRYEEWAQEPAPASGGPAAWKTLKTRLVP